MASAYVFWGKGKKRWSGEPQRDTKGKRRGRRTIQHPTQKPRHNFIWR